MNKLLSCAFASVLSATVFATAVRTLPEPDADGYYAFGATYTYSGTTSYGWKSDANTPAYPVWAGMSLPAGAKLKLTGGVIIDSWPTGVTEVDCTGLTFMAITATRAIPSGVKIVIPVGAKLCVCKGTTTVAGDDSVTWAESANNAIELANDLELDGTLYWHKNTLKISGAMSGLSTGIVSLSTQGNTHLVFEDDVSFWGTINSGNGQQNLEVHDESPSIGTVYLNGKATLPSYFLKAFNGSAVLDLEAFRTGIAGVSDGTRNGTFFCLSHGDVASIDVLGGGGCHFITQTSKSAVPSDSVGDATLTVGNLDPCPEGKGWSSGVKTFDGYVSRGISLEITKIGESVSKNVQRTVNLHYGVEAGANTNALLIGAVASGSSVAYMTATVSGPTPASLPRTMTLPPNVGLAGGVDVSITEDDWSFDFDWTKNDPNLSRCVITGAKNLTMPATGTISVNVTGAPSAKGVHPLFSCNVGCAALTDPEAWPVTIAGTTADSVEQNGVLYAVIRSATGISLEAKPITGLFLLFR